MSSGTQKCRVCNVVKPLNSGNFPAGMKWSTGWDTMCRKCKSERVTKAYHANLTESRRRNRAGKNLRSAVWRGKISVPDKCSDCGRSAILEGHHPDYDKPLVVVWVCVPCHRKLHHRGVASITPGPKEE